MLDLQESSRAIVGRCIRRNVNAPLARRAGASHAHCIRLTLLVAAVGLPPVATFGWTGRDEPGRRAYRGTEARFLSLRRPSPGPNGARRDGAPRLYSAARVAHGDVSMPVDQQRLHRTLNPTSIVVVGDKAPNYGWLKRQSNLDGPLY